MLVYLDEAYERRVREGRMATVQDLREAIMEGAVQRVRPKMMTVAAIMGGLLPIMWTTGTGADVMKRIAAPMIGGMVSSTVLTLVVIPAVYSLWKERQLAAQTVALGGSGADGTEGEQSPLPAGRPLLPAVHNAGNP